MNDNCNFYYEPDILSAEGIEKYLKTQKKFKITVLESIDSTNAYLKKAAVNGADENTVIIADSQTSGRGRFTRKFYSPKNCGIYMSILLKPKASAVDAVLITAAAAAAVSEAAENLSGRKTYIKWVNDVYLNSKKVCGILTEGSINPETASFDWVVLGIGINAYEPNGGFDTEIKDIAGAVFNTRQNNLRNRLAAEIINHFEAYYNSLNQKSFLKPYRERSLVLGRQITVLQKGNSTQATALEIDDNCRLSVEYKDGKKEILSSGEISIKL